MNIESEIWTFPKSFIKRVRPERNTGAVLVYSNPRKTEDVASFALSKGLRAQYLNSDIDEDIQKQIVQDFNSGDVPLLVTTPELANLYHLV